MNVYEKMKKVLKPTKNKKRPVPRDSAPVKDIIKDIRKNRQ